MRSLLLLALFPVTAMGAFCDKIDYAEVRDWPADQIEREYCSAMRSADNRLELWQNLRKQGVLSTADNHAIMAESQSCLEVAGLMRRTLINLHGRKPVCSPPNSASEPRQPQQ